MTDSDNLDSLSLFEASALPVMLIFILALVLRLFRLSEISLGSDELALHFLSGLSPYKLLKTSRDWAHDWSPFYPFFSHWWPGSAATPFLLRFPSVIWGSLTTLYLIKLGTDVFSRRSALIAGFLLAISPWHIYISQEAGYGAFYAFLIIVQLWYFRMARSRGKYWIPFCLVSLLAAYTSYSFIPYYVLQVVAVVLVSYLFWSFNKTAESAEHYVAYFPRWFFSCAVIFLGFYPWIVRLSERFPDKDPFTAPFSYRYPAWYKIVENLFCVGGFGLLVIGALAVWGIYKKRKSAQVWELALIALGGIPAAWQLSYPINSHFIMRQLVYLLPLSLLFVAGGIEGMIAKCEAAVENRRWFWRITLVGLLLFFNRGAVRFDFDRITGLPGKPDWAKTAKILQEDIENAKVLTLTETSRMSLWFHTMKEEVLQLFKKRVSIDFPVKTTKRNILLIGNNREGFLRIMKGSFRTKGSLVYYQPHLENTGKNSFISLLHDSRFGRYFQKVTEISSPQVYRYDFPLIVFDDQRLTSSTNMVKKNWGVWGRSARSASLGRISGERLFKLRYLAFKKGDYCLTLIKKDGGRDLFKTDESLSVYYNDKFLGELRFKDSGQASLDLLLDEKRDSVLTVQGKPGRSPVLVESLDFNRLVDDYKFIRAGDFQTTSLTGRLSDVYRFFQGDWIAVISRNGFVGYNFALRKSGRYRLVFCALHGKHAPLSIRLWVDGRPVEKFYFGKQDRTWGVVEKSIWLTEGFHQIKIEYLNKIKGNMVLKWLRIIRVNAGELVEYKR